MKSRDQIEQTLVDEVEEDLSGFESGEEDIADCP